MKTPMQIESLLNVHSYLTGLKEPSETMKECTTLTEKHIKGFLHAITHGDPTDNDTAYLDLKEKWKKGQISLDDFFAAVQQVVYDRQQAAK